MPRIKRVVQVAPLAACLLFASCARLAVVSERRPQFQPRAGAEGASGSAGRQIAEGMKRSRRDPAAAIGMYLTAARSASDRLQRNPTDAAALEEYNFAVARVFTTLRESKLDPWTAPLTVPTEAGEIVLTRQQDSRVNWDPARFDLRPADQLQFRGRYVKQHELKPGLGAPLVALGREENANRREELTLPRICYGVTAVARFSGRQCVIEFLDPLATETVDVGRRTFSLAADFTAPIAMLLAQSNAEKLGLARLINPEKYSDTARIARLQPYDPNKTVVLVVHGLNSSPATYAPMINALRADEAIRRNYQFWFFSYPSGYPYPYSASILRTELDEAIKRYPLHRKMVVIGHSMGGCISRLLITDVGDDLWLKTFGKPPSQTDLPPETKALISESLIFNHRPEVGRVIFISSPLRGADMASRWTGRLGARLVKAPLRLVEVGKQALNLMTLQPDLLQLHRIPNSVDTLAPNNRFVRNINTFPLVSGVPVHSIVGDRGKGGNRDKTKPCCSDGIVPYWSSHIEGAVSEIVVPTHHNAHQHPEAIAEVRRILTKYRGQPSTARSGAASRPVATR